MLLTENLIDDAGNAVSTQSGALDGLIEESNSEDTNFKTVATARIRRTGSKILSIVRFSGVSGMCFDLVLTRSLKLRFLRYYTIINLFGEGHGPRNCQ